MFELDPASALLYLSAVGLTDRPVPLGFARCLLCPDFQWPVTLADLSELEPGPPTMLRSLWTDDDHRLVIYDREVDWERGHWGWGGEMGPADGSRVLHVLSNGWRRRCEPLFFGHPADVVSMPHWDRAQPILEPDGTRLVRLHLPRQATEESFSIPIVELDDIVPELAQRFEDMARDPASADAMYNASDGDSPTDQHASVVDRIVAAAMRQFTPWPYPFTARTDAQLRLRPRESIDQTVALFGRLLDAPGPIQPTDLTAYFFSLIMRQRGEFSAWPEELDGVWAFKIKTGDHNWIEGRIWHEPFQQDDPSDPVEFEAEESKLESSSRYRDRMRHSVSLRTGSLRCFIQRDDT